MKKIGIVSAFDPHRDKKAHSGILFKINEAVEKAGFETIWIRNPFSLKYKFFSKLFGLYNKIPFLKKICFDRTFLGGKLLAATIDYQSIEQVDYILVIHYFHVPAFSKITKPIIYHSDATFELANNYYYHNIVQWNVLQAEEIEKKALKNSAWHLSSSLWREKSVTNHYGIPKEKCAVLEYGTCIDKQNIQPTGYNGKILHLLFMGVDWERKGGDIAVETTKLLNQFGIKTILTIIGIKKEPISCKGKKYINFVGYLNKNIPSQYHKMKDILQNTDILLLPTKAECSAVVFCEAAYYGIPVVTFDTGGVGNYVVNNVNGIRLPLGSSPQIFAEAIKKIATKNTLETLSKGAKMYSQNTLNWERWTNWFKQTLSE